MNPLPYEYNAALVRVVDGDTLVIKVDLGFKVVIEQVVIEQVVRLYGVNTPEIVGPDRAAGLAAKQAVEDMLSKAVGGLRVKSHKPDHDKYGRYLADVYYELADGTVCWLNDQLLKAGLAAPYFG